MNQYSTEPEYTVEESEKIPHMESKQDSSGQDYTAVEEDLHLLYHQLGISIDILGKIQDSLRVLGQSLREQV